MRLTGVGGEILGSSRRFSLIWSKKRVESTGTVVQGYVGGLLRLGGDQDGVLYQNPLENSSV